MTLADLLDLFRKHPENPHGYERYIITRADVQRAEDLLADDSIEVVTIPGEEDPEVPVGREQLMCARTAIDVLDAWSNWRDGRTPDVSEAAEAIMWFVDHDAFIPLERAP